MARNGGRFYPKPYREWRKNALPYVEDHGVMLTGPTSIKVFAVCKPLKTVTRAYPRADVDNFAKAALDLLQDGGVIQDDSQVVELRVTKRFAAEGEEAHLEIVVN